MIIAHGGTQGLVLHSAILGLHDKAGQKDEEGGAFNPKDGGHELLLASNCLFFMYEDVSKSLEIAIATFYEFGPLRATFASHCEVRTSNSALIEVM